MIVETLTAESAADAQALISDIARADGLLTPGDPLRVAATRPDHGDRERWFVQMALELG